MSYTSGHNTKLALWDKVAISIYFPRAAAKLRCDHTGNDVWIEDICPRSLSVVQKACSVGDAWRLVFIHDGVGLYRCFPLMTGFDRASIQVVYIFLEAGPGEWLLGWRAGIDTQRVFGQQSAIGCNQGKRGGVGSQQNSGTCDSVHDIIVPRTAGKCQAAGHG